MRGKSRWTRGKDLALPERDRCDIAEDLERLGIRGALVTRLAARLEERCQDLEPEAYAAALEGAIAAFDATGSAEAEDVREIQRLMEGFAGELQKLEEGLRIVSAYVVRMQERAKRDREGLLH
jgi:vacuolar-type H+-ATPase subunit C/Vma6